MFCYLIHTAGPALPVPPMFLNGVMTDTTSFQIDWEVVRIAYTPESYVVVYGTSVDTLDLTSETVQGSGDIASTNGRFTVVLRNLDQDTTFHFRIVATNAFGSNPSELMMFTTETGIFSSFNLVFLKRMWVHGQWRKCYGSNMSILLVNVMHCGGGAVIT